jgi:hypothetical protein
LQPYARNQEEGEFFGLSMGKKKETKPKEEPPKQQPKKQVSYAF